MDGNGCVMFGEAATCVPKIADEAKGGKKKYILVLISWARRMSNEFHRGPKF